MECQERIMLLSALFLGPLSHWTLVRAHGYYMELVHPVTGLIQNSSETTKMKGDTGLRVESGGLRNCSGINCVMLTLTKQLISLPGR